MVRFIKNERRDAIELHEAAVVKIQQPSRASHDDVRAFAQQGNLRTLGDAAENRHRSDPCALGEHTEVAFDLHGKLARWRDDQNARPWSILLFKQSMEKRQRKRGRLPCTRLSQPEHIAALEYGGNGADLNGTRLLVARSSESFLQNVGQTELAEPGGRVGGRNRHTCVLLVICSRRSA